MAELESSKIYGDLTVSKELTVKDDITVNGTVDGRDIAADGSKLDGIESGATKDQTASEILTAIKTVDGSGSGLDADKLDGQEGSYYRNASNINAGTISDARLPSSITSSITGNAATATKLATARTLSLTGDVTGSTTFDGSGNASITATVANDSHSHSNYITSNADDTSTGLLHLNRTGEILKLGATADADKWVTLGNHDGSATWNLKFVGSTSGTGGNELRFESQWTGKYYQIDHDGNFEYYDGANTHKIFADNYHPNADKWTTARTLSLTGDVTGSTSWDGSGNASITATVANDSHSHSNYLLNNSNDEFVGQLTVDNTNKLASSYSWTNSALQTTSIEIIDANTNDESVCPTLIMHNYGDGGVKFRMGNMGDKTLYLSSGQGGGAGNPSDDNAGTYFNEMRINNNKVWHAGNDGSGSGLDADLLDGKHASEFQPAGTYNTIIGTDSDLNTSGATIIDNIYVTDGVITSMGTRTLSASNLGISTSAGEVGSYAYLYCTTVDKALSFGGTYSGTILRPASGSTNQTNLGTTCTSGYNCVTASTYSVPGTWRCMGYRTGGTYNYAITLFVRIS
jgi:hypothetical protein